MYSTPKYWANIVKKTTSIAVIRDKLSEIKTKLESSKSKT